MPTVYLRGLATNLSDAAPVYPFDMRIAVLFTAALLSPLALQAQDNSGFSKLDPSQPTTMTVPQIIERMGKREEEFRLARDQYEFRETVKMDTISDDNGRPDGEYQQVQIVTFNEKGERVEHVVFAPQNTLQRVIMTENDLKEVAERHPFILTTSELPEYNLTYLGKQNVDELDTYVFEVAPKELVKGKKYFQGKIWVDQQDIEIVLVNGMTVPQETRAGKEDLSPPFTTYYEQIDGKYWFPTYTKAEGVLHFAAQNGALSQEVHMRNTVRYTDYKKFNFKAKVTIHYGDETLQKPEDAPKK